jgi:2-oxoglutarate ferredoxin oxidoreductase subunit delta
MLFPIQTTINTRLPMSSTNTRNNKTTSTKAKGRPQIDPEICKGCELCVAACPEGVLRMSERSNSQGAPYAEYDPAGACSACKFCAIICPDNAIEIYKFEAGE